MTNPAADRKTRAKRSDPSHNRLRDAIDPRPRKRGHILGLLAFEKISAVEGIQLTGEMREDLASLDVKHMDDGERSRFILGKYART